MDLANSVISAVNYILTVSNELAVNEESAKVLAETVSRVSDLVAPMRDQYDEKYSRSMKALLQALENVKKYLLTLVDEVFPDAETGLLRMHQLRLKIFFKAKKVYNRADARSQLTLLNEAVERSLRELIIVQNHMLQQNIKGVQVGVDEILAGMRLLQENAVGVGGLCPDRFGDAVSMVQQMQQRSPTTLTQAAVEGVLAQMQPKWCSGMEQMSGEQSPLIALVMGMAKQLQANHARLEQLINTNNSNSTGSGSPKPRTPPAHAKLLLPVQFDLLDLGPGLAWSASGMLEETEAARSESSAFIAAGGCGTVYRVCYEDDFVALKYFGGHGRYLTEAEVAGVRREVLVLQRLRHKNIISIIGADMPKFFMLMELAVCSLCLALHDPDTAESIKLHFGSKMQVLRDVLCGLSYLHRLRIVHRDIKSANILLVDRYGANSLGRGGGGGYSDFKFVAKLGDFGLAKSISGTSSFSRMSLEGPTQGPGKGPGAKPGGSIVGTAPYIAPELMRVSEGEIPYSPASDIYAYGILFNECLSGQIPFPGAIDAAIFTSVPDGARPRRFDAESAVAEFTGADASVISSSLDLVVCNDVKLRRKITYDADDNEVIVTEDKNNPRGCWAQDPSARPQTPVIADLLVSAVPCSAVVWCGVVWCSVVQCHVV
jgi:serine/threonine protein kinase